MLGTLSVYIPQLQISYRLMYIVYMYIHFLFFFCSVYVCQNMKAMRRLCVGIGVKVADIPAHVGVHGEPQAGPCVREDFTGRHRPCAEQRLRVSHGVDND